MNISRVARVFLLVLTLTIAQELIVRLSASAESWATRCVFSNLNSEPVAA